MAFDLAKNSQIIHIVAECVILIGITFYFISRNNKLSKNLALTSKRVADLEEKVARQDNMINQLLRVVNSIQNIVPGPQGAPMSKPNFMMSNSSIPPQGNVFQPPRPPINPEERFETDSTLDKELVNELGELEKQRNQEEQPEEVEVVEVDNSEASRFEEIKETSAFQDLSSAISSISSLNSDLKSKSPSNKSDFSIQNDDDTP